MKNNTRMFDNEVWSLKNVLKNVWCLKFDNEQEKFERRRWWCSMFEEVWKVWRSLIMFDVFSMKKMMKFDEVWWRWSLKKHCCSRACVCLWWWKRRLRVLFYENAILICYLLRSKRYTAAINAADIIFKCFKRICCGPQINRSN